MYGYARVSIREPEDKRGRFWRKDGCVWCPESDHFFRKDRKDGTFPRSLPHCAGCWSPARDEGASGSSSRYCGYSSIFRLGRSTPRFGMPTGDSCRPTGSAYPLGASAGGAPGAWVGACAADWSVRR